MAEVYGASNVAFGEGAAPAPFSGRITQAPDKAAKDAARRAAALQQRQALEAQMAEQKAAKEAAAARRVRRRRGLFGPRGLS